MKKLIGLLFGLCILVSVVGAEVTNDITPEIFIDFTKEIYPVSIIEVILTGTPHDLYLTDDVSTTSTTNLFSVQLPTLVDGNYILKVIADDDMGNRMTDFVDFPFTVDSEAEPITIEPDNGSSVNTRNYDVIIYFGEVPFEFEAMFSENGGPQQDVSSRFSAVDTRTYSESFVATDDLFSELWITGTDSAGNDISGYSKWWVNINPPIPEIVSPLFGIITEFPVDLVLETNELAQCRYSIGTGSQFRFMDPFELIDPVDGYGLLHNISIETSAIDGDYLKYYVVCQDLLGTYSDNTLFNLKFDTSEPVILQAFASPEVIYQEDPETEFFLEVDEPTKCKYDPEYDGYGEMRYSFIIIDLLEDVVGYEGYSTFHTALVNHIVPEPADYEYFVACVNLLGNFSSTEVISFAYDPDLPVSVKQNSPARYVNETAFMLEVETNREALCKYSMTSDMANPSVMGSVNGKDLVHKKRFSGVDLGTEKYYVECKAPGLENIDSLTVTVTVDDTPPSKPHIEIEDLVASKTTWRDDELEANWEAEDNVSGISKYEYSIWRGSTKIYGWKTTRNDGASVDDLDLKDGKSYFFKVRAMNKAFMWGDENKSISVKVDTSLRPPYCDDGERGANESDIDCGQACDDCGIDKRCFDDSDCKSGFCLSLICKTSTCSDNHLGPKESDVDCGGDCSQKCEKGKNCTSSIDCSTGLTCSNTGECITSYVAICNNNKYDPAYETDVDCGKLCITEGNKCSGAKKCTKDLDCKSGTCTNNVCFQQGMGDTDNDGISDSTDNCYNVFNPSQKNSDSDGQGDLCDQDDDNDKISDEDEIKYGLDPLNPEDAEEDKDGDGLTNSFEILRSKTNPGLKDTDGNGKSDYDDYYDEGSGGFWKTMLWIIIILVVIGIIGFGLLFLLGSRKKKKKVIVQKPAPLPSVAYKPIIKPVVVKPRPSIKAKTRDDSIKAMKDRIMKEFEVPKEESIEAKLDKEEKKPEKKEVEEVYFEKHNMDFTPELDNTLDKLMKVAESNEKSFDNLKKEIAEKKKPVKKKTVKKKSAKRKNTVVKKTTVTTIVETVPVKKAVKKKTSVKKKTVEKTIPNDGYTEVTIKIPNNSTTHKKVTKKIIKKEKKS